MAVPSASLVCTYGIAALTFPNFFNLDAAPKSSIGHGYFKNEICAAKLLHLDSGLRNFLTGFGR